jgi:fructose-bisphosphate aldolase class I
MYEYENTLRETARALVAPNKGILAADESFGTIEERFKTIDVASTADSRRAYREILFTTSGSNEFISGAILFDETIRPTTSEGQAFADVLLNQGIIPGIKVDKGTTPLPFSPGEKITEGLDGLRARLKEYRQLGARFAKWREVLAIGEEIPSRHCMAVPLYLVVDGWRGCEDGPEVSRISFNSEATPRKDSIGIGYSAKQLS